MTKKNQDLIKDSLQPKKKQSKKVWKLGHGRMTERTLERLHDCGSYLELIATFDKEIKKVTMANFCKNRYCPICAWRRSRKDSMMLSVMMTAIQSELKQEFIFMTLTTPNVKASDLANEIDLFNKSFQKMFKRRKVERAINGYVRKLEVTYNKEQDTYNPHFHVLLAVDKSYFTNTKKYIKQSDWLDMWREVTGKTGITDKGTDEITQLDIRKVKGYQQDKAIREVAKYSAKDFEMTHNQTVFDTFYFALKGRQLITFNGVFKEYKKKYDTGELDKYKTVDENEYYWMLFATWMKKDSKYAETFREMTKDEFKHYNKQYQEESEID